MIAEIIPKLPKNLVWLFSQRYIAGAKIEDALNVSRDLNKDGIKVTLDVLGEFITTKQEAETNTMEYLELIKATTEAEIIGSFSVKPTSFGLLIDEDFCYQKVKQVVATAAVHNRFVRIDMEDSKCVDKELAIFEKLYKEYPANIGIVLQAYLKRTLDDIRDFSRYNNPEHPINIRLCKGIYIEPASIAYKGKDEVNQNYLRCLDQMMDMKLFPALATHDKYLIEESLKRIKQNNLNKDDYEFQMLYGVTPNRRSKLVNAGHTMRIYVPFGKDWFGYSTRRLKENPRVVTHIIKSLIIRN
ncbi:MAG: proline dehydrogenase family protein [Bacteroidota bacterium]